ncbi:hypothetical protein EQG63_09355 [Flavobacterium amnicola]|uniref:Papain-like cysteine peptidase n=1 Tax=Flavobacterium amnicola TaxID=2506422 RepID=A0A4Q1K0M2_9FLAO|nr:DUF1796 family putative cysteine peptidase [Flavobacterium amnicola]RXR17687.1 hypothetical protein EQG63_09355 [Flavobacterium amnicola]
MKRKLKKSLKMFLPYGIVALQEKHKDYKVKKEKEYVFDVIFSLGNACRPAYHLQKHQLRFCANPLDWMMSYSLDTVIHLYQTKFNDFFLDYVEVPQKMDWFTDVKNNVTSIHYPEIGTDNKEFNIKMKNRFEIANKNLIKANKIGFICNRNDDQIAFSDFLKKMGEMYSGEITLIHIKHNEEIDGIRTPIKCSKTKISERLKLIEYEFNDVHENGNDKINNPDFWHGNVRIWNSIVGKIAVRQNFISYLLKSEKV